MMLMVIHITKNAVLILGITCITHIAVLQYFRIVNFNAGHCKNVGGTSGPTNHQRIQDSKETPLTPNMQIPWASLCSICRRLIIDQVPIDIMLQDEARQVEPIPVSIIATTNSYTYQ